MHKKKSQPSLTTLVADLEEEQVLMAVRKRLENGDAPLDIVQACQAGLRLCQQLLANSQ